MDIDTGGNVLIGGTLPASPNITLNADGSGEFTGNIFSGNYDSANNPTTSGSVIANSGFFGISTTDTGATEKIRIRNGTGTTFSVKADGSGSFQGGIETKSWLEVKTDTTVADYNVLGVTWNGGSGSTYTSRAQISASGSATFAGDVTAGDKPDDSNTSVGASIAPLGIYKARRTGDNPIWYGYQSGSNAATSRILADGSAEFEGTVETGKSTLAAEHSIVARNNGAGTATVVSLQYDSAGPVWSGRNASASTTASTSQINANGSASFASTVDVAPNGAPQASMTWSPTGGVIYVRKADSTVNITLNGGDGSAEFAGGITTQTGFYSERPAGDDTANVIRGKLNNVITSSIKANGSAEFAGGKALIGVQTNTANAGALQLKNAAGTTTIDMAGSGGTAVFTGTVTATVVPPSDARFKENITPAKPQLADVVALGGLLKNYDWNDQAPLNEEIRSQRQLGLIAQEAAEVCPAIVKDIHKTKQGAVITPEETIPAVYEDKVIPAVYETVVTPAKLGPKGKEIVPASSEEVLVTPERTEQVLVTPEKVIPATYETLDDSYKGISTDALIMKLIGAVAELSAEVTALKAAKKTRTTK